MKKITKEYQDKEIKELEKQLVTGREEIAKMTLSEKASPSKNTNLIFKKKKKLAVLLTVLAEKKEEKIMAAGQNHKTSL